MDDEERLRLVVEAVKYCKRVARMGMPVAGYARATRETIYYIWSRRLGPKSKSAKYRSRDAIGKKWGHAEIRYDHAIPFQYELKALMKLPVVTTETVKSILEKFDVCTIITAEEDSRLNAAGLQSKMPDGWDGHDTLARYKAVGIEVIENTGI